MLSESQCMKLEKALTENIEPRKIAAYLCFHMGVTVAEASALRFSDVDLNCNTLTISNTLARKPKAGEGKPRFELTALDIPRALPMPPQVKKLFEQNSALYSDNECFLVNGKHDVPSAHLLQNLLVSVNTKNEIADVLTSTHLRYTFIRRCLESGIDIYTVSEYVGIKQISELQKRFAQYIKPRFEEVAKFDPTEPKNVYVLQSAKRMNLIVLGAGSQGAVVKETAEAIGVFNKIAFLDDDSDNKLAIGSCADYIKYLNTYPIALPSFGDCKLRAEWIDRLEKAGFILPKLIHPMATVSPSASIEAGAIVEMKAVIGTNAKIEKGCIVSSGAIIGINAAIGENCHIGSAVTINKNSEVKPFSKLPSGTVYKQEYYISAKRAEARDAKL